MNRRLCLLLLLVMGGCHRQPEKLPNLSSDLISQVTARMTDVMVHDVTNPPLAARFFGYAYLAGYEVVAENDQVYPPMNGVLNDYPVIKKPADLTQYSTELSAVLAMLATAKKMEPSGTLLHSYENRLLDSCRTLGFSDEAIDQSKQYALVVSKQILAYAKADRYNRISNYPRYTPRAGAGSWYPTPPGFFTPVEPYFNTVRPFTLDTCNQFRPKLPVPFSTAKNSAFYALMRRNYDEKLSEQKKQIAAFWDCNPFALEENGHLLVGMKKISPGAHWLGITGIACRTDRVSFARAITIHAAVAIGLMDGFIGCWDEKFRSNRIRPETAIRNSIDPSWKPFLQTPPFPEYVSGHATISATSSVILTHYFGNHFAYTDSVENQFGLPSRSYHSFAEAANEAAQSRFYGGIHFADAVTNGLEQGQKIGNWVLIKLNSTSKHFAKSTKIYASNTLRATHVENNTGRFNSASDHAGHCWLSTPPVIP